MAATDGGTTVVNGPDVTAAPERHGILDALMRVEAVLGRVESAVVIAAMVAAVLAVGMSVVIRAFNLPIPDTGEWAVVAMSPLTFIGAALCSHLHRHLTADILEAMPRGTLRNLLEAVSAALFLVFGLFFIALAWDLFDYSLTSGETLTDLGTPVAFPTFFMVAGAVLMTFHAALDIWRALAGREPGGIDPWR